MMVMTSDTICRQLLLETQNGPNEPLVLAGMYRITAQAPTEIELIASGTLVRSLIYAGPDEIFLFIPRGQYSFHCRAIVGDRIAAELLAVTFIGKLRFVVQKAAALIRRGPKGVGSILRSVCRLKARGGSIVGAQVSGGASVYTDPVLSRPIIEPVPVPNEMRQVSIIIPTKKNAALLRACVSSLELISDVALDVVIVDNGATEGDMLAYLSELADRPNVRVVRHDIPFNFSRLCNLGAAIARHQVFCFLNDDIEACDGQWLASMLGYLARPGVGIVGARLLYPSGNLQHAGIATNLVPGPGHPWLNSVPAQWERNPFVMTTGVVDAVTAACMVIRRETFLEAGGFDETNFPITLNDVDLCLRIRERGLEVVCDAEAFLIHKEGQTRSADNRPDQVVRRQVELKAFFMRYPSSARDSVFYPLEMRRDSDIGLPVPQGLTRGR